MTATPTSFLDEIEPARLEALQPFRAEPSGRALEGIYEEINHNMFLAYGPDFRYGSGRNKLVVESPQRFDDLLRDLKSVPGLTAYTCRDMLRLRPDSTQIFCNLRHDVDGDLRGALQQAEMEAEHGIVSTFYILHTSYYYGTFADGVHRRNTAAIHTYRAIQDLGHEIALHTDPMHIYQNLRIDGAAALVDELKWLRDHGLNVTGTVSHNSAPVYGVNNHAVFKNRPRSLMQPAGPKAVVHHGKWAPLHMIDEKELALDYEGNDVFWQTDVPVDYACLMKHDGWYCETDKHGQLQTTPTDKKGKVRGGWRDQDELVEFITGMARGRYLLLSVHPEFYGLRHSPKSAPTRRLQLPDLLAPNAEFGWPVRAPHATVAHCGDFEGRQEFQSISVTNGIGMIDRPLPTAAAGPGEMRLLLLGRDNVDGRTICCQAQMTTRVERERELKDKKPMTAVKLTGPAMGVARLGGWLRYGLNKVRPSHVVIGIGANEPECSDPKLWSQIEGYDPAHPPGHHAWLEQSGLQQFERDPLAELYRTNALAKPGGVSLCLPDGGLDQTRLMALLAGLKAVMAHHLEQIRATGAVPILLVEECGESLGHWRRAADPSLRLQAWRNFKSYLPAWVPDNIRVVDPYETMLAESPGRPTHWGSVSEWNLRGHRHAAYALANALRAMEKESSAAG